MSIFACQLNRSLRFLFNSLMARPRNVIESVNGDSDIEDQTTADDPVSEPSGNQIPLTCPECNGPLYQIKPGQLAHFQCFVGHRFSPEGLSEQHAEALNARCGPQSAN